jgi:hypothetical protein
MNVSDENLVYDIAITRGHIGELRLDELLHHALVDLRRTSPGGAESTNEPTAFEVVLISGMEYNRSDWMSLRALDC